MSREDDNPHAIAHDRVFSFADDLKACFLQDANSCSITDAWQFGHRRSNSDDFAGYVGSKSSGKFGANFKVFANGVSNVCQSLLARCSLTAATRELIAPDGKTLFGLNQRYRIVHASNVTANSDLSSRLMQFRRDALLEVMSSEFCDEFGSGSSSAGCTVVGSDRGAATHPLRPDRAAFCCIRQVTYERDHPQSESLRTLRQLNFSHKLSLSLNRRAELSGSNRKSRIHEVRPPSVAEEPRLMGKL